VLQPKRKSKINHYYAAPSLEKAWTEHISLGEEFLKTKVSRSNVLSITANVKEQQILPANKKRKTRDFVETSNAGRLLCGVLHSIRRAQFCFIPQGCWV
jgi:hypothetical protein